MRKLPELRLGKIAKLDLGCADKKQEGYIGIDNVDYGQEIIWDVRDGIPFPDNSIDEVYSCHLLEHLINKESKDLFVEVYRILKPQGLFISKLPHCTHPAVFYPDHESFWNEPRIESMCRFVEGFEILENYRWEGELFFKLKKK